MSISSQSKPAPAAISVTVGLPTVSHRPTCGLPAASACLNSFGPGIMEGSCKITRHRAERPVIAMEGIAPTGIDRPDEGAAENDLAGLELDPVLRKLVGKPGNAVRRMIEHAGRHPGLLDLAVAEAQHGNP